MNRLAEAAGGFTHLIMSKPLRVIQLNVHKGDATHDSLMNDEDTQNAAVISIQEPRAWKVKEQLFTAPMVHHKWTRMVPSFSRDAGRWPIRSIGSADLVCVGVCGRWRRAGSDRDLRQVA